MSKATLESATTQPAAKYDIGDDDGAENNDGMGDDGTEWSESHDVRGQPWGGGDSGDGWRGWEDGQPNGADHDQSMGTGDWWDTPTRRWGGGAVRWQASGHGHWTRASWADQLEDEHDATHDDDGQPPAARRRLDAAGGDQATKETQAQGQQQQQQPAAQPSEPGGPGGGRLRGPRGAEAEA